MTDAATRLSSGWYAYRGFSLRRDGREGWSIYGEVLLHDGRMAQIFGYELSKGESQQWIDSVLNDVQDDIFHIAAGSEMEDMLDDA